MHEALARICAELTKDRHLSGLLPTCHAFARWVHRHEHWAHTHLHTVYFGLVAIESHGHYGKIAGVLFVLSIVGAMQGETLE